MTKPESEISAAPHSGVLAEGLECRRLGYLQPLPVFFLSEELHGCCLQARYGRSFAAGMGGRLDDQCHER